ncbi:dynein axonemal assembly factor 4-like [Athalia rosae]|uniref:dynein axonemal assembly factor 4-like n=1 Tax=Athalia rosae TaxID=37344 RepID=UPI002033AA1A|nr:dynein axonemal assembly factor 4-like [Athalia rosae]
MKDLENWRSTHENPILMDIEGKEQENRKAYRPALKWFKDESGELKSRKMTETEILRQGTTIEVEKTAPSKETSHTNSDNKPLPEKSPTQESPAPISESESNGIIQNDQNSNVTDSSTSDDSDCSTTDNTCQSTTQSFIKRLNQKRLEKFYKGKAKSQSGPRKTFTSNGSAHMLFKKNAIFDEPKKAVPLPRKTGTIDITFSERMFPTPARESHQVEEQEWLEKQAEARRQTGFIVEDLRPEELDPQWLKDKGDEFFKAGNYLGAISAYTHGIKLSSKMSSLYSNRSAAQYALGNYFKCTEDCSMALELMVPHCQGNLESRVKCHARRGAALCKLSSPQHGIPELEAALKLDPNNLTIKRDILAAKQYFNIQD